MSDTDPAADLPVATKPAPSAAPKAKKGEIDFDAYSVADERANAIRSDVSRLKELGWLDELRLLVTELGREDASIGASGSQIELMDSSKVKAYRGAAGSPLDGFMVALSDADIFVRWGTRILLEVMQLPKADEFVVLQIDAGLWEALPALQEHLKEDVKLARKMKSDRSAKFKGFGK